MKPDAMPGWQKDEPMTPTNDAEKAFKNYADKFCSIGYDPTEDVKIITTALATSAKVDGLLETLAKIAYSGGQNGSDAWVAIQRFNGEV